MQKPRHDIERGVRFIATLEALKGVIVVVAGFGLLSLIHHDLRAIAVRLARYPYLNPAHHYSQVFIEMAANINDAKLRLLATLAFFYALLRFVESYGLWKLKAWASWLAIISGAIYLPIEVYELFVGVTLIKAIVLLINACIVIYLIYARSVKSVTPGSGSRPAASQ